MGGSAPMVREVEEVATVVIVVVLVLVVIVLQVQSDMVGRVCDEEGGGDELFVYQSCQEPLRRFEIGARAERGWREGGLGVHFFLIRLLFRKVWICTFGRMG